MGGTKVQRIATPPPPATPSPAAQTTAPAASFYAAFDAGKFESINAFVSSVRPNDIPAVERLMDRIKTDKGEGYADQVIKKFYGGFFQKQPLNGWDSFSLYFDLGVQLKKSRHKILNAIGDFIQVQVKKFLLQNRGACPDLHKKICGEADQEGSLLAKAAHHYTTGGFSRLAGKALRFAQDIFGEKGAEGIREEYKTGKIKHSPVKGSLPGFSVEEISVNGTKSAIFIVGDPKTGAKAEMLIAVGGGATVEAVESAHPDTLQFQAPCGFQHGAKLPQELSIYKGKPVRDLPPDATRHDGYVLTFPDGRLEIVDKRSIRLSEITGKPEDDWVVLRLRGDGDITDVNRFKEAMRSAQASQSAAMLIATGGKAEWTSANGEDERRLLAQFGDGTFGVISTLVDEGVRMGINDMLTLLTRLGEAHSGIKRAVYLDTGHYDFTSYYTYGGGKREKMVVGHKDNTTQVCRIAFVQDKGVKK